MSEMNGIPSDLAAVLKDPGATAPQDTLVFELIAPHQTRVLPLPSFPPEFQQRQLRAA